MRADEHPFVRLLRPRISATTFSCSVGSPLRFAYFSVWTSNTRVAKCGDAPGYGGAVAGVPLPCISFAKRRRFSAAAIPPSHSQ